MGDSNKLATSEDEEDLEALRLAALQSLKKKNAALNGMTQRYSLHLNSEKHMRYNRSIKSMQNKRGRFFGPHQGRNGFNAQFNNRVRNTNLISIPTIPSDEEKVEAKKSDDSGVTLTLPQDRYCGKNKKEEKTEEGTSKFTRYDKSDKSDTESEEEEAASSEGDSPGKLKKSNSLEALMEELDAEIQGKTRVKEEKPAKEEKPKKKTKKKKRISSEAISTSDSDAKVSEQKEVKVEAENILEVNKLNENDTNNKQSEIKVGKVENEIREEPIEFRRKFDDSYSPALKRPRSRSPINRRSFLNRQRQRNFHKFTNQPPPNISFIPPPTQYPAPMVPFPNQPFNPIYGPPNVNIISQPPPFFDRPLSPLAINTESLTTATLAPLSPRSAAFVLENKAIIERRKRSPRRSYSRSPSRSPRRSLTPRRSPRRSITPRRISRSPRRLSRSPRRRSLSPRQRSLSPRRRNIGRSTDNSPKNKPPVRERLGVKPNKTEENKDKAKENEPSPKKEEKPLDPVLEARKRKFESNEIKMKEGIIRLKPKGDKSRSTAPPAPILAPIATPVSAPKERSNHVEEKKPSEEKKSTRLKESKELREPKQMKETKELKEPKQMKEVKELKEAKELKEPDAFEELEKLLNEDALLEGDDIELDSKVDDIFSDEDSASDNEGRFKVKQQTGEKPPILPFTKLVNGAKKEIKSETLPESRDKRRDRRGNRFDKRKPRGRSPVDKKDVKENLKEEEDKKSTLKKVESQEKTLVKNRITLKSERHAPPMEKRFERKIEIKIKNPSKYERGGKLKFSKDSIEKTPEKVKRKVELGRKEGEEEDEVEPEIVVENDSGDEENSVISEGDLRAQLSKKRAEKLSRIPVEGISSRLLQSALQGAVFKEKKKKSKDQDITSSDGKLPVYLRLGIANNSDIFTDTKVKRKSRKRKNREVLEQV